MKLSASISLILVQLGTGVLLTLPLVPTTEVRRSYFTFHSTMAAVCFALAAAVQFFVMGNPVCGGLLIAAVVLCVLAFAMASGDRLGALRIFYLLAAAVGLLALIGSGPNHNGFALQSAWVAFSFVLGAILLGAVHNAMGLGHWYLISRNLSFDYLIRITKVLMGAVVARAVFLIAVMVIFSHSSSLDHQQFVYNILSIQGDLMFFLMRIAWGLALPLILAFMAWRCAVGKANQAATGLLYLCEVSVLFGELFAAYLLI